MEYAYITEAFGPLAGFVYCWMRIAAAEPVGTAVFAVALADYTADTIYDDCAPPGMLRKSIAILAVGKWTRNTVGSRDSMLVRAPDS